MSEPSPEAKQAPHRWNVEETENGVRICKGDHQRSDDCEWEYYSSDTATAKLRDELDFIKTEHAILNARLHGEVHPKDNGDWHGMTNIPKLREELAQAVRDRSSALMRVKQLAHQQPRRWPSEVPLFGKPAPNQQPSAPTADVEKIVRELRDKIEGSLLAALSRPLLGREETKLGLLITTFLAQARAPLVEALEGLVEAVTAEVNEKGAGGYLLARLSDARAALTGTGEKLSPGGPVTTNKKGDKCKH